MDFETQPTNTKNVLLSTKEIRDEKLADAEMALADFVVRISAKGNATSEELKALTEIADVLFHF